MVESEEEQESTELKPIAVQSVGTIKAIGRSPSLNLLSLKPWWLLSHKPMDNGPMASKAPTTARIHEFASNASSPATSSQTARCGMQRVVGAMVRARARAKVVVMVERMVARAMVRARARAREKGRKANTDNAQ